MVEEGRGGKPRTVVHRAEPLGDRAKLTIVLLVLVIVVDLVAVWADLGQLDVVNRIVDGERVPFGELKSSDDRVATTGILQFVALVLTAIAFLLWYSRAYRNVLAMGMPAPRWGTRWAVGSWFVPFVNLVMPKQVCKRHLEGERSRHPPQGCAPAQRQGHLAAALVVGNLAADQLRRKHRAQKHRRAGDGAGARRADAGLPRC